MDSLLAILALGLRALLVVALMRDPDPSSDAGGWLAPGLAWIAPTVPMFGAAALAMRRRWRWRWLIQLLAILYAAGSTPLLSTQQSVLAPEAWSGGRFQGPRLPS
jgi:hypothetical protein